MLKGPKENVKLERSGGVDYLVGGEEQCVFRALLTPCSVDMAQVNKRLEFCLGVSCKSALCVSSLHTYTVSPAVCSSSCWYSVIL